MITEANNVLNNHKFDTVKFPNKSLNNNKTSQKPANKDKKQENITVSFAQIEGKCYCCGKAGHMSPQCCFEDNQKAEWAINKSQKTHIQMGKKAKTNSLKFMNQTPQVQEKKILTINILDGLAFTSSFTKLKK
jgi:hypothetical protein